MKHSYRKMVAGAVLAGLGLVAAAQPTPMGPSPRGPMHMQPGGPMADHGAMHQRMRQHMQQRMAQRFGVLKHKLAITPQQEGAWNQWMAAMQPSATRIERPNAVQFARMNTPERIDAIKKLRAQRQQRMDSRLDATKAFYGTLGAQQQKVFDEEGMALLRRGEGRRGGRHHGPRG